MSTPDLMKQVRVEQTYRELLMLSGAITKWIKERRESDTDAQGNYIGRHKTQLDALGTVLNGAAEALMHNLNEVSRKEIDEVYRDARGYDQAIVWLRRLWEYFRVRFDQRDDERTKDLVKAADEIVWSCYRQVFFMAAKRQPNLKQGAAPLAFIEPEYSPAAVQSSRPLPRNLQLDADLRFLDGYLKKVPLPVLRLPPWCVEAPWWLVFVGHEVGHHIQHDLKLVGSFRAGVERAAREEGLSDDDVALWGAWSEEIFADVFSVCVMGASAVWAVAEVERSTHEEMATRKDSYPAPVVRLALLARTADALSMNGSGALRDFDLEEIAALDSNVKRDMDVVDEVVAFALGEMEGGIGTLPYLCGLDLSLDDEDSLTFVKEVNDCSRDLRRAGGMPPVVPSLKKARVVASGALTAWASVARMPDAAEREAARLELARRTKETLLKSGEPGTRSHLAPADVAGDDGEELARLLLGMRASPASDRS